ncbi:MAG: WYL domain-containing protein [Flavobacteriaceae bacterium]
MSKKHFIKRHILIINRIRKNPCSFKEIEDYLERMFYNSDENYSFSKRTFERDLKEIREIYNIDIQYNRSSNTYVIEEDYMDEKTQRIIESFEIYDFLSLPDSLSEYVLLEKRKPLATEYLQELLFAIKNKHEIEVTHQKFGNNSKNPTRKVYPLALKEALFRWYLVAFDPNDGQIKTFGLERILEVKTLKTIYSTKGIPSMEEKFRHSYGIITDGTKPEKVVLSVLPEEIEYLKSLPLHHSQKIVSENEKECIVELFISPTYDFIMEILSMGKEITVLEPVSLRENIKEILKKSLKNYKK